MRASKYDDLNSGKKPQNVTRYCGVVSKQEMADVVAVTEWMIIS